MLMKVVIFMPRKRKYDYQNDLPVSIFVKVPVRILNILEDEMKLNNKEISKIVENFLIEFVEKNRKKD